jgi:hypothetical protein
MSSMFLDTSNGSRSRPLFVGVTLTFILASLFVAARLVSRFGIVKHRGWDDYLIVLAWVSEPSPRGRRQRLIHLLPDPRLWHVLHHQLCHL